MRNFYIISGILCLLLAGIGILVPGLPATPFLLLAGYLFASSSRRMHDWLVNNKIFGSMLSDFIDRKGMPLHIKVLSIAIMWGMVLFSIFYLMDTDSGKYLAAAGALFGTIAILRFKTLKD